MRLLILSYIYSYITYLLTFPHNRKTPETLVSGVNLTLEHKYLAVRYIYKNLLQQFPFSIINLQTITTIGTTTVIIRNIVSPTTWTFLFHHNGLAFGLDSIRITRSAKLPVMLFTFRHDMLIILKKGLLQHRFHRNRRLVRRIFHTF